MDHFKCLEFAKLVLFYLIPKKHLMRSITRFLSQTSLRPLMLLYFIIMIAQKPTFVVEVSVQLIFSKFLLRLRLQI
jgi:hypothetical protein